MRMALCERTQEEHVQELSKRDGTTEWIESEVTDMIQCYHDMYMKANIFMRRC